MIKELLKGLLFLGLFLVPCLSSFAHQRDTLSASKLTFIENKQQWHSNVLYKASVSNGTIFVEKNCITYIILNEQQLEHFNHAKHQHHIQKNSPAPTVDAAAYKVHFVGANPNPTVTGNNILPYHYNYFLGNDPAHWASEVNLFESVYYKDIYQNIDLKLYQENGFYKYEFIVNEDADPERINLNYQGAKSLTLSNQNLIVTTAAGQVTELKPKVYQINAKGDTLIIPCKYKLSKQILSFELGEYNRSLKLIIDPTLIFSTFSGSISDNWGYSATYDSQGNVFGGGIVFDVDYPTTDSAFQINFAGGNCDMAISKFNATGTNLIYSTFFGGNGVDIPNSMIVNDNDELYVLGTTSSSNFPVTPGAYDNTYRKGTQYTLTGSLNFANGSDITVSKFSIDGKQLLASTYLGGSGNDGLNTSSLLKINYADEARGEIMIDNQSNVYIVSSTQSTDFPVTQGAFQLSFGGGTQDACIVKFNHNLSNLIWSSYLGGEDADAGYSIVISSDNSIYVCGGTASANFPVMPTAYQTTLGGGTSGVSADGFITHIDEFGTQILHSTFLGSNVYDQTYLIKNDRFNNPHVYGQTNASGNFWIKNAAWHVNGGGQFLTKLTPDLESVIWSTAFGTGKGGPDLSPTALLVDLCNNIYMSGWGSSIVNKFGGTAGLPTTSDAFQHTTDNNDYYFIAIKDDASALVFASFFGSPNSEEHVDGGTSRFDQKGRIYQAICAGCRGDNNFPTTLGAWSNTNGSHNCNLAVVKIDFNLPVIVADFTIPNTVCLPDSFIIKNNSQVSSETTSFSWDFGDGTTSNLKDPTHQYTKSGLYTIRLVVEDLGSCNFSDTAIRSVLILASSNDTLPTRYLCTGESIQIGIPPSGDQGVTYHWSPNEGLSNPNISNPVASPEETIQYTLLISNGICNDTLFQTVEQAVLFFIIMNDTTVCLGEPVMLHITDYTSIIETFEWSLSPDFDHILNDDITQPFYTIYPTKNTTYYIRVKNGRCITVQQVKVNVSSVSLAASSPVTICFNEPEALSVTAYPNCSYHWTPENLIVSGQGSNTVMVNSPKDTVITVVATNESGCTDSATFSITVQQNTFEDNLTAWAENYYITEGDTIMLYSTEYRDNEYTYNWTPAQYLVSPHNAQTLAFPQNSTIYTVTVTDSYGCAKSDTTRIHVNKLTCDEPYIFIPNAFTPNGDGNNDVLYVRGALIDKMLLRIYDRWGTLVFESTHVENGWDGKYKGQICQPGVYDYYLEITCIGNKTYFKKGNITLIK